MDTGYGLCSSQRHRMARGFSICRTACGLFLLIAGIIWIARLTGFIPAVDPLILKGIFPAGMIIMGVLLLAGINRGRNTGPAEGGRS